MSVCTGVSESVSRTMGMGVCAQRPCMHGVGKDVEIVCECKCMCV